MSKTRSHSLFALAVGLFITTSCSTPASTVHETPQPGLPSAEVAEVPHVAEPLDARQTPPCAVVGPERADRLGVVLISAQDLSDGPAARCAWTASDGSFALDLVFDVNAGIGLAHDLRDAFPEFQPSTIGGHPAVQVDPLTASTCRIWVGIAEGQVMTAGARKLTSSGSPLCAKARALAVEVIDALRSRS